MAAGGMIGRAIQDAGAAWEKASAATAQGVKITVNEHNILKAAAIIEAEADRFYGEVEHLHGNLHVKPMGGDPVSKQAAWALTQKFRDGDDSYYERCLQRVEMLRQLAEQLKEAASTYGLTEEQIQVQFQAALRDVENVDDDVPRHGTGGMRAL